MSLSKGNKICSLLLHLLTKLAYLILTTLKCINDKLVTEHFVRTSLFFLHCEIVQQSAETPGSYGSQPRNLSK